MSAPRAVEDERHLYVYYKVPEQQAADCLLLVQAWLAQVRQDEPGLSVSLLRRPQVRDGQQTWMEVYQCPAGVNAAMQARIEARAQAQLGSLGLQRRAEVFIPLSKDGPGAAQTPASGSSTGDA